MAQRHRVVNTLLTASLCATLIVIVLLSFVGQLQVHLGDNAILIRGFRQPILILVALAIAKSSMCSSERRRELIDIFTGSATLRRSVLGGFLIFVTLYCVYVSNDRSIGNGDTIHTRLLPSSIIHRGDFDLNEFFPKNITKLPYWVVDVNGRLRSFFPFGSALVAMPIHFVGDIIHGDADAPALLAQYEKTTAAALAALSAVALWFLLRRLTTPGWATVLCAIYALCSNTWSTSSQKLWQHGPSTLLLIGAIYCWVRAKDNSRWLGGVGALLGLAMVCRPTDAAPALVIAVVSLIMYRRGFLWLVLFGAPILAGLAAANWHLYGSVLGGYGALSNWNANVLNAVAGHCFSPSRGIFVFMPVLIFSLLGGYYGIRHRGRRALYVMCLAAIAFQMPIFFRYSHWWGGHCFGPRYWTDVLPFFVVLIIPVIPLLQKQRLAKWVFAILLMFSFLVQVQGAYCLETRLWNYYPDVDSFPERLWDWRHPQWLAHFQRKIRGVPTAFPFARVRGHIGKVVRDSEASGGYARYVEVDATENYELMSEGTRFRLPEGEYMCDVVLKARPVRSMNDLQVIARAINASHRNRAQRPLAFGECRLSASDFPDASSYSTHSFSFSATPNKKVRIQLLVRGSGEVWADHFTIRRAKSR